MLIRFKMLILSLFLPKGMTTPADVAEATARIVELITANEVLRAEVKAAQGLERAAQREVESLTSDVIMLKKQIDQYAQMSEVYQQRMRTEAVTEAVRQGKVGSANRSVL
jgi:hypothetical protein